MKIQHLIHRWQDHWLLQPIVRWKAFSGHLLRRDLLCPFGSVWVSCAACSLQIYHSPAFQVCRIVKFAISLLNLMTAWLTLWGDTVMFHSNIGGGWERVAHNFSDKRTFCCRESEEWCQGWERAGSANAFSRGVPPSYFPGDRQQVSWGLAACQVCCPCLQVIDTPV